jgi:hypothetical protein
MEYYGGVEETHRERKSSGRRKMMSPGLLASLKIYKSSVDISENRSLSKGDLLQKSKRGQENKNALLKSI